MNNFILSHKCLSLILSLICWPVFLYVWGVIVFKGKTTTPKENAIPIDNPIANDVEQVDNEIDYHSEYSEYIDKKGDTLSARECLAMCGKPMSAIKFNKLMVEKGFLTLHIFNSPISGREKREYFLTDKGLEFGINQNMFGGNSKVGYDTNKVTYDPDKFSTLLGLVA